METWWTIYVTATGELKGHTSVEPTNVDPAWSVASHTQRMDQDNVWDSASRTWIIRPPDPPGAVLASFTLNGIQPATWTNMPSVKTPLAGSEQRVPMFDAQYARLQSNVRVAGASGAVLIAQVSDDGVTYVDGPSVGIGTTGLKVSSMVEVPVQYRVDAWIRMAGSGGNNTADPQFGLTTLQIA